ncbi:amidase [Mycoplana dimorpha]|uniref:Aspartyl-tRNA(Asn)/glutamyl-tRNA(Gln) amidotransferase subunit A n=1 Tax=Mycoplana dimorpha TaxID=28320 RepID=A0A2T5B332_MYCDI|nr:amidase [Mycoplana dimorpha]PTM93372.1 aspartyl-tRNA(Asn)/glutamyl-tRNA(Gln) amidotransferase subunit A [Mycoplana dimorpha]
MTDTAPTLAQLADDLGSGRTTSRALVEECLARIEASSEGRTTFVKVSGEAARQAADAMDLLRRAGAAPSRWAGIPVSIKDLFDIEGEVTTAGSRALADAAPAKADAPAVARLRRAGFVVIGRTNMTEFAYSGLGLNPHYGTPRSVWDRDGGRIPGGSSSGAAISVAEGMAHAALGTDTGGSCRIPAAFNRLVGYKPTARRVPRSGAVPLSTTLDSIGPIARSVACCATLDAILAGEDTVPPRDVAVSRLRLAVPTTIVLDGMDATVAEAFRSALSRLSAAGAVIEEIEAPEFADIPKINAKGGFSAAESHAWHRELLERRGEMYDPRVAVRIRAGASQSATDYIELGPARRRLIDAIERRFAPYDAVLMPTVGIVPPRIAELADDADFARINLYVLRNAAFVNMFDGCAISLPIGAPGAAPVGLMVSGTAGMDRRIFEIAQSLERLLQQPA